MQLLSGLSIKSIGRNTLQYEKKKAEKFPSPAIVPRKEIPTPPQPSLKTLFGLCASVVKNNHGVPEHRENPDVPDAAGLQDIPWTLKDAAPSRSDGLRVAVRL
jgi:hypothetical protein